MTDLVTIFCEIDDFCKEFSRQFDINLLSNGSNKRKRSFRLTVAEVITIMVMYHQSGYKTFQDFYEREVLIRMQAEFPGLVSYTRFLELRKKAMLAAMAFAQLKSTNDCSGISFIDSFPLEVCHIKRSYSHKVLKGFAEKGKTSTGWFFGLKLHLVINHKGEIVAFFITPGNVADNNEEVLTKLTKKLFGKLFGDRGYIINQKLFEKLFYNGVHIITKIRKNMRNKLMDSMDKFLLRKRGTIESVGSILKQSLSIEHSRHRSISGFFCHVVSGLISYSFREKKPSIVDLSKINLIPA